MPALAPPVNADCTRQWIDAATRTWCLAFGGTLDADVAQPGAGDEINRTNRQADGPVLERGQHSFAAGIHYDSFELDESIAANLDMYRIELRYRLQLGRTAALQFTPALATSSNRIFEDMSRDDILLQAAYTHRWPQHGVLAGVVRDARLGGGLKTYPVVSVPLSFDGSAAGAVGFPDSYLTRQTRSVDYTLWLGPRGYRWHVLDGDGNFRFDVKLQRWELGFEAARRRQPRFYVAAGIAFAREIHFTASNAQRLEPRLDPALFATFGWRPGSLDADPQPQRK